MRYDIDILTTAEVDALLGTCGRYPTGLRDRALMAVLAGAGLRIQEALDLKLHDVDLDGGMLTVQRGKGGKRRVVGMTAKAQGFLEAWLERRKRLGVHSSRRHVFCQVRGLGKPIEQANVRKMLRRRTLKAGIVKRVHAHGFRHYHAFQMAQQGLPVHVIQAQLGHQSLAVTSRYVAHLSPREVVAAVRRLAA